MKGKSLNEIIEEEGLIKLVEIHYKIRENKNSSSEERYNFESSIIDDNQNEYKELELVNQMKIVEDTCIFYTKEKQGFYMENNSLLKKTLLVLFDKKQISYSDIIYVKKLINIRLSSIVHEK